MEPIQDLLGLDPVGLVESTAEVNLQLGTGHNVAEGGQGVGEGFPGMP